MSSLRQVFIVLGVAAAFQGASGHPAAAQGIRFVLRPIAGILDGGLGLVPGLTPLPPEGRPNYVAAHDRAPLTPSMTAAAHGGNEFAFDLFQQLAETSDSSRNLLLSPFSISTALAMTYAGAGGETAAQMRDVFHFRDIAGEPHAGYGPWLADLNQSREGYELSVANRLFGQDGFAFRQPFLDQLANDYQAPLERLDFKHAWEPSRVHINDWVEDVTHDRIKDLIPEGFITDETRLVLTNAMYFKGGWARQFEPAATRDGVFYLDAHSPTKTSMMAQIDFFRFGKFDGYRMLEMPYAGGDLSMVFVLPEAVDGLDAVASSLTTDAFQASVDALQAQSVLVSLPKFKIEDSFKLGESLQALGMVDAFEDYANFDDMVEPLEDKLKISEVVHKTFLELDEQGTEAAAATAVIMVERTSANLNPPVPETFNADHPFLFAIRDRHTDGLLFLGRMADPGGQSLGAELAVPEPTAMSIALALACVAHRIGLTSSAKRRRRERLLRPPLEFFP
jgi:serpin B